MAIVSLYLGAIIAANLAVASFGPSASILNAFLFIGLDLTARDKLHQRWQGDWLWPRMACLVASGGILSYLLNADAGAIAIASTVAFVAAGVVDAAVFAMLRNRSSIVRVNASNACAAAADSLIFPTLAFGALLPVIVAGQFAAKVGGGFVWSVILDLPVRRQKG